MKHFPVLKYRGILKESSEKQYWVVKVMEQRMRNKMPRYSGYVVKIKNIRKLSYLKTCVVVLFIIFIIGCGLCGNEVEKEIQSPTGNYKAVVFQRDCGATTGFSTHISIIKNNRKLPNGGGNIFIADTNHGEAPSAPWGGPQVMVTWKTDTYLIVHCSPQSRIFEAKKSINGIDIEYNKDL